MDELQERFEETVRKISLLIRIDYVVTQFAAIAVTGLLVSLAWILLVLFIVERPIVLMLGTVVSVFIISIMFLIVSRKPLLFSRTEMIKNDGISMLAAFGFVAGELLTKNENLDHSPSTNNIS